MTDNRNVPPKVEQQAGPPKVKRKPDEPWWAWAGIALGAALILHGVSELLFMLSGINLNDLVIIPVTLLVLVALTCACAGFPPRLPKPGAVGPPKPSSKPFGIIAAGTLACGAFLMMAPMIVPAIHAAREAAMAGADSDQWKQHVFGDGKFSVMTPASWQPLEDPTVPADVYLADITRDLVLTAMAIPKVDAAVNDGFEFTRQAVAGFEENVDSLQSEELIAGELNGFPVIDTRTKATMDGTFFRSSFRCVDFGDTWVYMHVWTTPSKYAEHQETLSLILDSVKVHR